MPETDMHSRREVIGRLASPLAAGIGWSALRPGAAALLLTLRRPATVRLHTDLAPGRAGGIATVVARVRRGDTV